MFTAVYNPEQELIAAIEAQEMEIRNIRRRIEHAHTEQDKRVLNRLLAETEQSIEALRQRLG